MWWHEPYESRGSRTDLREARGETPRAYSAVSTEATRPAYVACAPNGGEVPFTRHVTCAGAPTAAAPSAFSDQGAAAPEMTLG